MGASDQETVLHLMRLLLSHKSSGKLFGWIGALLVICTFAITMFSWNLVVVHYFDDLNHVRRVVPIIATGLQQTRDSLNLKGGYHFSELDLAKR